jgi:hypothetical protein
LLAPLALGAAVVLGCSRTPTPAPASTSAPASSGSQTPAPASAPSNIGKDGGAARGAVATDELPVVDCRRGALTAGTVVIEERQHSRTGDDDGPDEKVTLRKEIRGALGDLGVRLTVVGHENLAAQTIVTPVERSYMDLTPCKKDGEPRCLEKSAPLFDGFEGDAHKTALMAVESSSAFHPIMFEQARFFRDAAVSGLKPGAKMPSFKQVVLHLTDYSEDAGRVTTTFVEERTEPWGAMRVFRAQIALVEHFAAMGQSAIVKTDGTATALVRAADGAPIEIDIQATERKTYTRFSAPTETRKFRFRITRPCFRTAAAGP